MRCMSLTGRKRRIIPVLLGILVLNLTALAQDLPAAKPEAVGLSSDRLERIATAVQHDIDDKRIAGAVTLVVRHGKVAWFKSQGMADREAAKTMPGDAMFRICSMTKPITSVAVMMLYEEGKFLLDDPVSKYLPEFKNPKGAGEARVGRNLHDSGDQGNHDSRPAAPHFGNYLSVE